MNEKACCQRLRKRIKALETRLIEQRLLQELLQQRTHALSERVKELNCLYEISNLIDTPGITFNDILHGILKTIPSAWQYPEITCSRIILKGQEYRTSNYNASIWKQTADITVNDANVGILDVCYLEQKPDCEEGPFLAEERLLINAIAGRLGAIIERFQSEVALRESEERYRSLYEQASDGILLFDDNEIIFDANPQILHLLGYRMHEVLGVKVLDLIHPDDLKKLPSQISRLLAGETVRLERRLKRKDGGYVTFDQSVKRIKKNMILSFYRDISERKQAEQALTESEEKFRSIYAESPIGIEIFDRNAKLINLNKACSQILGILDPNELKGFNLFQDPYLSDEAKEVLRSYDMVRYEVVYDFDMVKEQCLYRTTRSGIIDLAILITPLNVDQKSTLGYLVQIQDISDRKQAEDKIRKLSHQLLKAQEEERRIISRELHDRLAQDLSASKIACDMINTAIGSANPEQAVALARISSTLETSIQAVRDLSYEMRPPELSEIGLIETIFNYCQDFSSQVGIEVNFQSGGMESRSIDPSMEINLFRLIQEGLNNIRKHAAASEANIRLVAAFPNIVLRIDDDGKGFNVYQRMKDSVHEKRMGLSSMQERVNLMGGQMQICSKPASGTSISIKVPLS